MKLYNRQNELLGDAAERAAVAADWLGKVAYPGKSLTEAWQRFIFHQFHDNLTGTHRHSAEGDHAYEFTYMFKLGIDIPAKATEVVLPDNKDIVIFAATLAEEPYAPVEAASQLFRTDNQGNAGLQEVAAPKVNLLKPEHIVAYSGYTNNNEKPAFLIDGNENTKWCDISMLPNYVDFLSYYPFAARYKRNNLSRNETANKGTHCDTRYGGNGRQFQRALEYGYP